MSNVHTFTPRRPVTATAPSPAPSQAEVRRQIEEAAQAALDTADRLIALLNLIQGDTDREDGADAELDAIR
jgi:nucleoside 2-deoxyribosyltransferase